MSALSKLVHVALLGAALSLVAPMASAGGIAVEPSALGAERVKLEASVQKARAQNPKAFEAVRDVKGHRPEHYRNNRNPYPTASRELRGLGPAALLPMLEALALDAPPRGDLTDAEWDALAIGMMEAVGVLRDTRARPVLHAAFAAKGLRPAVLSATARALGRLGGDPELALLVKHAKAGDPLELHAVEGLGQARRLESAKHLAARLADSKDADVSRMAARSLGILGSSWAWRALGPSAEKTGLEVRRVCADALAKGMARQSTKIRTTLAESILMVQHPDTVALLGAARPAKGSAAQAIDALIVRVERQQKSRR